MHVVTLATAATRALRARPVYHWIDFPGCAPKASRPRANLYNRFAVGKAYGDEKPSGLAPFVAGIDFPGCARKASRPRANLYNRFAVGKTCGDEETSGVVHRSLVLFPKSRFGNDDYWQPCCIRCWERTAIRTFIAALVHSKRSLIERCSQTGGVWKQEKTCQSNPYTF